MREVVVDATLRCTCWKKDGKGCVKCKARMIAETDAYLDKCEADRRKAAEGDLCPVCEQTCAGCAHSNSDDAVVPDLYTYCTLAGGFYKGKLMERSARCAKWQVQDALR